MSVRWSIHRPHFFENQCRICFFGLSHRINIRSIRCLSGARIPVASAVRSHKSNCMNPLTRIRNRIAVLEARKAQIVRRQLSGLHLNYGYSSPDAFVTAFRQANPGAQAADAAARVKGRKPRAVITDSIRAAVLANPEQLTIARLAQKHDISVASVVNIRSAAGRPRKKK